jgi:hypothetical protein
MVCRAPRKRPFAISNPALPRTQRLGWKPSRTALSTATHQPVNLRRRLRLRCACMRRAGWGRDLDSRDGIAFFMLCGSQRRPCLYPFTQPATPAPSDKKKKKKKASSAGPTPVTTNNPSAVAPVPTPSSKAVHEAPPASATKPTSVRARWCFHDVIVWLLPVAHESRSFRYVRHLPVVLTC